MTTKSLFKSKMTYLLMIAIALATIAKFYIGFYKFDSHTEVFLKPAPIWKSMFYAPASKGRNLSQILTEEEKYEQEMFSVYASDDFLKIIACDDIFDRFANKPTHMEYIGCDVDLTDRQTLAVSNYRVTGENVLEIESYLTEHHFMPPMKAVSDWGYETRRSFFDAKSLNTVKNRELERHLKQINPAISVDIEMSGVKEEVSYDRYGSKLVNVSTMQKEDVPYYFISVNLLKI